MQEAAANIIPYSKKQPGKNYSIRHFTTVDSQFDKL